MLNDMMGLIKEHDMDNICYEFKHSIRTFINQLIWTVSGAAWYAIYSSAGAICSICTRLLKYCTDGQLINKMEGNGYASYTKSIQLTFHTMHLTQEIWPVSMASGVVR